MHHTHLPVQQALSPAQGHIHMNNRRKYFSSLYNCNFFVLNCNLDQDRLKKLCNDECYESNEIPRQCRHRVVELGESCW